MTTTEINIRSGLRAFVDIQRRRQLTVDEWRDMARLYEALHNLQMAEATRVLRARVDLDRKDVA